MHDYDRRRPKTAAQMDLYGEWREIVRKHEVEEGRDFADLLRKAVPYLRSVGYDLDLSKSYLSKSPGGSDGPKIQGTLVITEREENTTVAQNPQAVRRWILESLDVGSHVTKLSEGPKKSRSGDPLITWQVLLGE